MKKLGLLILICSFLMAAAPLKDGGDKFTGTLVDTKCYSMMPDANKGNTHKAKGPDGKLMDMPKCATACANMGIPVALLDKKGNMHVLAVPASQIADHMAKEARIQGEKKEGVLVVDKLEVKEADGWQEVQIAYMMK